MHGPTGFFRMVLQDSCAWSYRILMHGPTGIFRMVIQESYAWSYRILVYGPTGFLCMVLSCCLSHSRQLYIYVIYNYPPNITMSDPTNTSQFVVGYSPGDFFYSTVSNPPDAATCAKYSALETTLPCESNFKNNAKNCVEIELCKNNDAVKQMYDQSSSKWQSDELNYDILAIYRAEYIFMWNLGIAIIGMLVAIYYLYSSAAGGISKTLNNAINAVSKRLPSSSSAVGGPGAGATKSKPASKPVSKATPAPALEGAPEGGPVEAPKK